MKVLVLYQQHSETATAVEMFIHDFQQRHDASHLEVIDVDSREGSAAAALYDIMSYPAILVLREDGSVVQSWQGEALPLMDDLAYYTSQG